MLLWTGASAALLDATLYVQLLSPVSCETSALILISVLCSPALGARVFVFRLTCILLPSCHLSTLFVFKHLCPCAHTHTQEETAFQKNAVEAYLYKLRNGLYGPLEKYASAQEKEKILAKLQVRVTE